VRGKLRYKIPLRYRLRCHSYETLGLCPAVYTRVASQSVLTSPGTNDLAVACYFSYSNSKPLWIRHLGNITYTRALQPVAICHQSPYLRPVPSATKPAIIIMTSFARLAPTALVTRDYTPAILIMTSFATELATPSVTDNLQHLIYKDSLECIYWRIGNSTRGLSIWRTAYAVTCS